MPKVQLDGSIPNTPRVTVEAAVTMLRALMSRPEWDTSPPLSSFREPQLSSTVLCQSEPVDTSLLLTEARHR